MDTALMTILFEKIVAALNRAAILGAILVLSFWWSPSAAETHEDHLIKSLKESFVVGNKRNLNPLEHELLNHLIYMNVLKNLSGIKSISGYIIGNTEFQIWKFDNNDDAKLYFDIMKNVVWTNAMTEKPPKCFFLVSGADELYYFTAFSGRHRLYMLQVADNLINCCFSESEVHFARDHYR